MSSFHALIATGGVGSGSFFALDGDHTLGREESRSGRFLNRQDYCKLHIIAHYVKALTGAVFSVFPVSKVGDDDTGRRLLLEMEEIGLETKYMGVSIQDSTLFSFCFIYPDGSGGNLTTSNAATAKVDRTFIEMVEPEFIRYREHGIALAVPEVPLEARKCLLELGTKYGFYRAASFTRGEILEADTESLLERVDLLAANLDEATALAKFVPAGQPAQEIVVQAAERLRNIKPDLNFTITAGQHGSWCWDGSSLSHVPAIPVEVIGTAGAGDAHLAGILVGLVGGLSLKQAHQLGALMAACSITSPHTLHKGLGRQALYILVNQAIVPIDPAVIELLC